MSTYSVRVKPGASRTRVGGGYGDPPALVVAVSAPAVDGRANDAVVLALADALEVRRAQISIVSGHTARSKVVEVDADVAESWAALLDQA
ncbi:MAG: DUF167 domain-containing protein [Candidatus Nanopelagicales bacterium]